MPTINSLHGFVDCSGTIAANSHTQFVDSNSVAIALFTGMIIRTFLIHSDGALSSGATINIGFTNNLETDYDYLLPLSEGLTTDDLNSRDWQYHPSGLKSSFTDTTYLVLTTDTDITSGVVEFYIEYHSWGDL